MVKRAVKGRAGELGACSEDEFIPLGLHVSGGRAVLETIDGKPTSTSHSCVHDVVAHLRFPSGELRGVVGVPLPVD